MFARVLYGEKRVQFDAIVVYCSERFPKTKQYANVIVIKPIDLRKRGRANAVRPYGYGFSEQSPYTVSAVPPRPSGGAKRSPESPFPGRSEAPARTPRRAREERSSFRLPSCAAACTSRAGGFSRSAACAAGANNPFPAVFAPANLRRDLSENREPDEYAHTLGVSTIPEISPQKNTPARDEGIPGEAKRSVSVALTVFSPRTVFPRSAGDNRRPSDSRGPRRTPP